MAFPDLQMITVGGRRYKLVAVNAANDKTWDNNNAGLCKTSECLLLVEMSGSEDSQRVVALHELIHAVDYETGSQKNYLTEEQTERLAGVLVGALRSNPVFTRWLIK